MRKLLLFALFLLCAARGSAAGLEAGKYYKISLGDYALFTENASARNNAKVLLWVDTKVAAQRWQLIDEGQGCYSLRNAYTGLYLGYMGSRVYQQSEASRQSTGIFKITNVEGNKYVITPKDNEARCLQAPAGFSQGDQVMLNLTANATSEQKNWVIEEDIPHLKFSATVRDEMMDAWLEQNYNDASTGHVIGNGGWWGDAEMFETVLDAFETTGDTRYEEIFNELYNNFIHRNNSDWSGNEFNDDITWMVLACIRAYKFFGLSDYLDKARENFDRMYNRAQIYSDGMLKWKQSQTDGGTNSCINCPATVAACYLAELTGDDSYYQKAISIYEGQRKHLFNTFSGQVYDSGNWQDDNTFKVGNTWSSTYNQGTMLGAALMLYKHTRKAEYRTDADRIYHYTIQNLTNGDSIVKVCQTVSGDLCGFKGIFMRYARRYAQETNHPGVLSWMQKNAFLAYQNRNSYGETWSRWLTKTAEDLIDVNENNKHAEPFGNSTAVSVAFNAHVNAQFYKDAYAENSVRNFDEIQWLQLKDDSWTTYGRKNAHIGFLNVQFGEEEAKEVRVEYAATTTRARLAVYVDSISEQTKVGATEKFLSKDATEVIIPLTRTLTGSHHVYFVLEGTGKVALSSYQFNTSITGISSTEAADKENLSVEPVAGGVSVKAPAGSQFRVYSVSGQLLAHQTTGSAKISLRSGAYVVTLSHGNDKVVEKIMVK